MKKVTPAFEKKIVGSSTEVSSNKTVLYTPLEECVICKNNGKRNMPLQEYQPDRRVKTAHIWTGAEWTTLEHGTKKCTSWSGCGSYYKLNYVSQHGCKKNTLTSTEDSHVMLMTEEIGFTISYLRQYWNRVCRCGVAADGEAATILLTFPGVSVGNCAKRAAVQARWARPSSGSSISQHRLSQLLKDAMFAYLRLLNKEIDFDLNDPVKADDPTYGAPSQLYTVLFDATKDDPGFKPKKIYNVVTDGNQAMSRRLHPDERVLAKRLARRPKHAVKKKPSAKRESHVKKIVLKRPSHAYKLCAYVKKQGEAKSSRTHVGGVYASMDMENLPSKGNLILHLVEMLNSEDKGVKEFALIDMASSNMPINELAHDCNCIYKRQWEGKYCKVCKLDAFHWKTHKCGIAKVTNPKHNSQAAEQLWGRLDNLHFATEFSRARYRYFLKNYCKWRNNFLRSCLRADSTPLMSHGTVQRRS